MCLNSKLLFKVAYDIGEEGSISCVVRAYPEPRFDWTLEDDVLGNLLKSLIFVIIIIILTSLL